MPKIIMSMALVLFFVCTINASAKHKKSRRIKNPVIASKYSSVIIHYPSKKILHAKNPHRPRYPASLAKVMTLYLLFEALDQGLLTLDTRLPVSQYAAAREPSKLGLKPGQTISVRNAIFAIVTKSANDVATVIAEALAGNESSFAQMMTEQARRLGMHDTLFYNASGLPDVRQKTTAADMVKLAIAVIKRFPHYYHYFQVNRFKFKGKTYRSHNQLLKKFPGCDGLKTGYIHASGFNVLTSAVRNGKRVVAVVMGGRTAAGRDQHMVHLLKKAYKKIHPPKTHTHTKQ